MSINNITGQHVLMGILAILVIFAMFTAKHRPKRRKDFLDNFPPVKDSSLMPWRDK